MNYYKIKCNINIIYLQYRYINYILICIISKTDLYYFVNDFYTSGK